MSEEELQTTCLWPLVKCTVSYTRLTLRLLEQYQVLEASRCPGLHARYRRPSEPPLLRGDERLQAFLGKEGLYIHNEVLFFKGLFTYMLNQIISLTYL